MKMYIARDEDGSLYLYKERPHKEDEEDGLIWWNALSESLMLNVKLFPEVTFENSPQEVELKLIEK